MASTQDARIVTCSKHGIPYDASKRGGCARCIREWDRNKAQPKTSNSGLPVTLLGALVVAIGLFVWFQSSSDKGSDSSDPTLSVDNSSIEPTSTSNSSTATSASENALRKMIDQLPKVIQAGRVDTAPFIADVSDSQRQREDWEFWSSDWAGRIEQLRDKMPKQPNSQKHLKLAALFQNINEALNVLATIPQATTDGIPNETQVRSRFLAAEKALQNARLHLAQLHK